MDKLAYASEIVNQIELTRKLLKVEFFKQCDEFGFTLTQIILLKEIHHAPGLTLNELSERLNLAKSTVSEIVSRLETKNMLKRIRPNDNKRITRLYLTDDTCKVDTMLDKVRQRCYKPLLTHDNEEEIKQILDSLKLLNSIIDKQ